MLAKPGEESGLYKRQSIHVKTGIVTGTGGVLKKCPPPQSGRAILHEGDVVATMFDLRSLMKSSAS